MAKRSTPDSAFRHYQELLREALGCIASGRLSLVATSRFEVGPVYALALNDGLPVTLKGETSLQFSAGQRFRIVEATNTGSAAYLVQVVDYWYQISIVEGREILAFHWTPEADPAVMKTTPHLHIGSVNIAETAPPQFQDLQQAPHPDRICVRRGGRAISYRRASGGTQAS